MNYIIDTHIFLWFLQDSDNLSHQSKTTIANIENNIFISIASFWEIAIKLSLEKLPFIHKDPFDRLIIDRKSVVWERVYHPV